MTAPERPTPEQMLARAREEEARAHRGRLKVFFGASPGVGKTYTMLEDARRRRDDGEDVVIGWVETHGRRETEGLAQGLERLPPRVVDYKGATLRDFDLDAALARRPHLLLVDELAHTNAPGLRHARRFQDVEELLDAGINVATTLNVQHLESVNDLVARITGVAVRETVPDAILDRADEVELVDLPPDDLLQRLREGKVYVPDVAQRALQQFFRKGNLIALRELALRRTAERVDAQADAYKREQGIVTPWQTRERILVAVGPAPQTADLVRSARRMAAGLRAPWIAVSVEGAAFDRLPREDRERVAEHLALAEQLGAETVVVRGDDVAVELLALARERNVTRVLVGKPTHARWRDLMRGSLVDRLVRGSQDIDVLVTAGETEAGPAPVRRRAAPAPVSPPAEYLAALVVPALITAVALPLRGVIGDAELTTEMAMVYLAGVLLVAARRSWGPALAAVLMSVAAFDFFFVPPYYTFRISDPKFAVTFAVMLAVGLTVSTFTVRTRQQAEAARQRERRTAALFAMSREFAVETEADEVARTVAGHAGELLDCEAVVLLPGADGALRPSPPEAPRPDENELAVARWAFIHGRPAGHGTDTLPGATALWLPLAGTRRPVGVLGVRLSARGDPPSPSQQQLLETYAAQAALALERVILAEESARAVVSAETERTRSALLSAISHDVRTPLTSITSAAATLLDERAALDDPARRRLLQTVWDESESLARLVGDLLDLTRLATGALVARKEMVPVEEVIASAMERMERRLSGRPVRPDLPHEIVLAPVDPVLMEQVVAELLENAVKYSPPGAAIDIVLRREGDIVSLQVEDRGPGIEPGEEERIFDRFYRGAESSSARGTGLGLTVCRAIVQAHAGRITATNRPGGGAVLRVELPAEVAVVRAPATGGADSAA